MEKSSLLLLDDVGLFCVDPMEGQEEGLSAMAVWQRSMPAKNEEK